MRVHRAAMAAATAVMIGASLVGCGGGDGAASGKDKVSGTVTMWTYPVIVDEGKHKAFWDKTAADFKKKNPEVTVDVKIFPWAKREEALTTAIAAQKGPDVVYLIPDQLAKYHAQRALEPVDAYLGDGVGDYRANVRKAVTMDGKMMGAPILMSALTTMCDKRAFAAVGQQTYPETWDDLLAMAPKFKAAGYDVTSYLGDLTQSLNLTFYPLLWQAGGKVFSDDGKKVEFNNDAGAEALTFVKKLVDGGYVDKATITEAQKPEQSRYAKGKVACLYNLAPQDVQKFWGKENIVIRPPLKQKTQAAYGTIGSLAMLKQSKNKAAAGAWLKYVTSPEVMKAYDTESSYFSPKSNVGDLYKSDPVLGELEKVLNYTNPGPLHPKARDLMGVLAPQIQAALLGKRSPQEALEEAAKLSRTLL